MSDTYTKLFSSITESTVWGESYATRIVWVTMLAMADASGHVYGAIPGLARRANVTLPEVEQALQSFMAPDPYSRTKENDGRRIEEMDGGWRLINHAKYGAIRNEDERRAYKRDWDRENRPSGHKRGGQSDNSPTQSDSGPTKTDSPTPPTPTPTPSLEEKQKQQHVQPMAARCRFAEFWAVYPNKKSRQEAEKAWKRKKLDPICDELITHVQLMQAADDGWQRGYIPMGSTYINQARWEDIPQQAARAGPQAAPQQMGKTAKGLMALEDWANGGTGLVEEGNWPRAAEAAVLEPGPHSRSGHHHADGDGVVRVLDHRPRVGSSAG
ncbi:hypothetical protein ACCQ10_09275 [Xanthomonas sp. NCPPB 1325]|uniref:hypothetical protein n=1 Tax=Xanthomonas sp. NCPPB 1325 TaxID=487529 RepID=UPI0035592932